MPGSAFPRFFLTMVVVQNVPLLMIRGSMANGCDVTKGDVTGSDVTKLEVRVFPRFFLTIVVVQNVPLRMTDMATGYEVTG